MEIGELGIDFLNSDWHDYLGSGRREDRIRNPNWLASFLERWGLDAVPKPTEEVLDALVDLRTTMQRIVARLAEDTPPEDGDIEALNAVIAGSPFTKRLVGSGTDYRIEDDSVARDWPWVRAEIALSLAELIASRDPQRIKLCENEDCRWVFYDSSKSRTRRWCADSCGNLLKVRRFRERQRRKPSRR